MGFAESCECGRPAGRSWRGDRNSAIALDETWVDETAGSGQGTGMVEAFLLVIGALLGVGAERLYRWLVEKTPRVEVRSFISYDLRSGYSFKMKIKNIGFERLPPFEVSLRHPKRGMLNCFTKIAASDRLPGQYEVFQLNAPPLDDPRLHTQTRQMYIICLTKDSETGKPMSDGEFRKWALQLILIDSDQVVLFDDNRSGVALALIIKSVAETGQFDLTGHQMLQVYANNSWTIRGRRHASRAGSYFHALRIRLASNVRIQRAVRSAKGYVSKLKNG